jgi:micrococcal nuclease
MANLNRKNLKLLMSVLGLLIAVFFAFQQQNLPKLNNQPVQHSLNSPTVQIATNSAQVPSSFTKAQVTKVVDGDTIDVEINGEKKTVRFVGINTPETVDPRRPVQCFGKEASDETKKLLTGQTVFLEKDISETDKYDRLLRYVYLPQTDGNLLFVDDYLVREGFAQVSTYPPDVKYVERFTAAEHEAQQNNRGLWGKCNGQI